MNDLATNFKGGLRHFAAAVLLGTILSLGALSTGSAAEAAKTYQVTGPIVELTEKAIVVQKGDERWEIARDETTKATGDLKVGQKVTVHYRMTATRIESKPTATQEKRKTK